MRGELDESERFRRKARKFESGVAAGAIVDRIGDHVETRLSKHADGARHVDGRRDEQPALAGFGKKQFAREDGVLISVARAALIENVALIESEVAPEALHGVGFRVGRCLQRGGAAGEDEPRARIFALQRYRRSQSFGGVDQRGAVAAGAQPLVDRAAEHDDAVGRGHVIVAAAESAPPADPPRRPPSGPKAISSNANALTVESARPQVFQRVNSSVAPMTARKMKKWTGARKNAKIFEDDEKHQFTHPPGASQARRKRRSCAASLCGQRRLDHIFG